MSFDHLLAGRTANMGASAIREILKLLSQPGMISLAGGIPAPESFPVDIISGIVEKVIRTNSAKVFQYDMTEGFVPLREALADYLGEKNIAVSPGEILISCGSQGTLDALAKILLDTGDKVAVEAPTYLGALQAFNPYGPEYIRLETDEQGLIPDSLESVLQHHSVKMIYLVPTFQNPTGRTIPLDRRRRIAEIIQDRNALVVEDDPYSELRYTGDHLPTLKTLAPDHVVYVGSFSKILAPGLRIGYCAAPEIIRRWLILVKQGVDLHTSTFNQAVAAEYLAGGHLKAHLPRIIGLYKPRQAAMLDAMETHFPNCFSFSKPEGGMFIWASGPPELDMETLYHKAVKKHVAYVPGNYFYAHKGDGPETMRLNFTMTSENTIRTAIEILADVIKDAC